MGSSSSSGHGQSQGSSRQSAFDSTRKGKDHGEDDRDKPRAPPTPAYESPRKTRQAEPKPGDADDGADVPAEAYIAWELEKGSTKARQPKGPGWVDNEAILYPPAKFVGLELVEHQCEDPNSPHPDSRFEATDTRRGVMVITDVSLGASTNYIPAALESFYVQALEECGLSETVVDIAVRQFVTTIMNLLAKHASEYSLPSTRTPGHPQFSKPKRIDAQDVRYHEIQYARAAANVVEMATAEFMSRIHLALDHRDTERAEVSVDKLKAMLGLLPSIGWEQHGTGELGKVPEGYDSQALRVRIRFLVSADQLRIKARKKPKSYSDI